VLQGRHCELIIPSRFSPLHGVKQLDCEVVVVQITWALLASCLQAQHPPEEEKGAKRARREKVNLEVKAVDEQDFINRLESELKATQDGAKNGRNRYAYIQGNTKHIDKDTKPHAARLCLSQGMCSC
jgi:hypothetical protein